LWVSEAVVAYNNLVSGIDHCLAVTQRPMSGVEQLMRFGTAEGSEHQKRSG
jgi:hypothetical protein